MSIMTRRVSRAAARQAIGEFRVSGATIIAPDNTTFIPLGANVAFYRYMMPGFTYNPTYSAVGKSDAALEWGWNTIRIPLRFDDDFTLLDQLIVEYTNKKIVCIIDCHELWRDKADGSLGVNSARIGQLDAFWQTMATKYKNNTYVWFNLHNEPPLTGSGWADIHVRHARIVRDAGAQNIIVCDAPSGALDRGPNDGGGLYSWDASMLPRVITEATGNVILSFHNYGYRWCDDMMDAYVTNVTDIAPLMIGELGYNVTKDGESTAGSWDTNYLGATASFNAYHRHGIGSTMWIGSGGTDALGLKLNSNSFWVNGAGNDLAGLGVRLWAIGHGTDWQRTIDVNLVANPLAIDTSSYGYGTGWKASNGATLTYRTGQSWATNETTTDVQCSSSDYISYIRSYEIDSMAVGVYQGSCDAYLPYAASFEVVTQWQTTSGKNIGSSTKTTYNGVAGRNTFSFTTTKPDNAGAIWMSFTMTGYPAGATYAVTNLIISKQSNFFSGSTADTSTAIHGWTSLVNLSASTRVITA